MTLGPSVAFDVCLCADRRHDLVKSKDGISPYPSLTCIKPLFLSNHFAIRNSAEAEEAFRHDIKREASPLPRRSCVRPLLLTRPFKAVLPYLKCLRVRARSIPLRHVRQPLRANRKRKYSHSTRCVYETESKVIIGPIVYKQSSSLSTGDTGSKEDTIEG